MSDSEKRKDAYRLLVLSYVLRLAESLEREKAQLVDSMVKKYGSKSGNFFLVEFEKINFIPADELDAFMKEMQSVVDRKELSVSLHDNFLHCNNKTKIIEFTRFEEYIRWNVKE